MHPASWCSRHGARRARSALVYPVPLTTPSCEIDFRPGGVFRLVMRMDGVYLPMDAVFREIIVPERIVFAAKIHGGNDVMTTVTFTERDGKTTLDVHQTYVSSRMRTRGANAGWTMTLNELAQHVARMA